MSGLGPRVEGFGFRGLGIRVTSFRVWGSGLGFRIRVGGLGFGFGV